MGNQPRMGRKKRQAGAENFLPPLTGLGFVLCRTPRLSPWAMIFRRPAAVISYLKSARRSLGLLINFNVPVLRNGIQRIVYSESQTALVPDFPPMKILANLASWRFQIFYA